MTTSGKVCVWCVNTAGDSPEHPDQDDLCTLHLAEYLGTSVAEVARERGQSLLEWLDTLG